ncbi:hypothetical protein AQJ67_24045 [Streptomyces caeruleatus]|uniref:Uncharacterized protein n=1 Tax=Streptomyces caeruleatus TaxID=661399 RepID=A0A101TXI2_9ACTN|nr:hypothetical protein AQJ67_24045 [Streptomyces caeruleatus]
MVQAVDVDAVRIRSGQRQVLQRQGRLPYDRLTRGMRGQEIDTCAVEFVCQAGGEVSGELDELRP